MIQCLVLVDASSLRDRRTGVEVKSALARMLSRLKADRDMPYVAEMACVYVGDVSDWDGSFDKIGDIRLPAPPDASLDLSEEEYELAVKRLSGAAEARATSGRRCLASVLILLTDRSFFSFCEATGVRCVWPEIAGEGWAFGLDLALSRLADSLIGLLDEELAW